MKKLIKLSAVILFISACNGNNDLADAYGNFEADEVTISAEVPGEILEFTLEEGEMISKGQKLGIIDTTDLHLLKLELIANMAVIHSQYQNLTAQINVLEAELKNLNREIKRTEILVASEAATQKQLDDLRGNYTVIEGKIGTIKSQNPSVFSQLEVAKAKLAQIEEKIARSEFSSSMDGLVLNKIAHAHQFVGVGSPLFTIADLSRITCRAYIMGSQLSEIKLGQIVSVLVDRANGDLKSYEGKVSWVSSQAEFTPKIIQTREERVDMVYAIKILVENDGALKIGMPAEVVFNHAED